MAGEGTFPFQGTSIPGLMCCGDSTFPGEALIRAGYLRAEKVYLGVKASALVFNSLLQGRLLACWVSLSLKGACVHAGIGLPAVAASGAITANSMVPIWDHMRMLDSIKA